MDLGESLQAHHMPEDDSAQMRVFMAGDIALTGLKDAALYLSVHENTVRRWADKGVLPVWRLPSGVRRFPIAAVVQLREQMVAEYEQSIGQASGTSLPH